MNQLPSGFKSDGCSGGLSKGWRFFSGSPPYFEDCCIWHDYEYAIGGNSFDRWVVDVDLFKCVYEFSPFWAYIVFFMVRVFGAFNFVWHWKQYNYVLPNNK